MTRTLKLYFYQNLIFTNPRTYDINNRKFEFNSCLNLITKHQLETVTWKQLQFSNKD